MMLRVAHHSGALSFTGLLVLNGARTQYGVLVLNGALCSAGVLCSIGSLVWFGLLLVPGIVFTRRLQLKLARALSGYRRRARL